MDTHANIAVVSVGADLDVATVAQVRGAIEAAVSDSCRQVVLNMAAAEQIDSAGIGLILHEIRALRECGGMLSIVNAGERVLRALRLARIVDFAPVSAAGERPEVPDLPPTARPRWRSAFPVEPGHMHEARERIGELLGRMGLSPDEVFEATLAAGEAVGNAVDHAGGGVTVTVSGYDDRVVVEVCDCGCGFELAVGAATPVAGEGDERGRGIALMRLLSDSVTIGRRASGVGTCVRIVKLAHPGR